MFRTTLSSARSRPWSFFGALLTFFAAGILAMAGGMLLQAALQTHPPVERYAGAAAVVTGKQDVGADHDIALTERARVPSSLAARLAAVPGVRAAVADVAVPARVGRRTAEAHGWSSARLTPYALTAGRPPTGDGEVVTGYPAKLGSRIALSTTGPTRFARVVGVASPRRAVGTPVVFMSDAAVSRLAAHPGTVDAVGIIAARGFEVERVRAASPGLDVLTGRARGRAEVPGASAGHIRLIAVSASFAGLGIFVALFVVASTMSLSIQQREKEIALLRAVAATPGQIRRMISLEAMVVALIGSAAAISPGAKLGHELARAFVRHDIAPQGFAVSSGALPAAGVILGGVTVALLSVLSAGRRAARVAPTRALAEASVEPRAMGAGRLIGGLIAIAGALPLFAVASSTSSPSTAAATSELTAIFFVVAAGCLGPIVTRIVGGALKPLLAAVSPVGGFLASANVAAQTRRYSSASTPLVLTVAMSCTLLFSTTTFDHAVTTQRHQGIHSDLVVSSAAGGLAPTALADVRRTPGVRSAVALTPTSLGPSLGQSSDTIPATVVDGSGGGLDVDVVAGSLGALHGDAIALGKQRASDAHAKVGQRVSVMLGDGSRTSARVVAIYKRALGFGEALVSPQLVSGHLTTPLLGTILVRSDDTPTTSARLSRLVRTYPGLRVGSHASLASVTDADQETNRWLGPLFVAMIFAFTSIAVVNTLVMIALRRGRELALLRLTGATNRQVRSMARWEAASIVAIGLGVGLAIAATALLPLSHALTGGLRPYIPLGQLGAILGGSALMAAVALALPTRRALRTPAVTAVGNAD